MSIRFLQTFAVNYDLWLHLNCLIYIYLILTLIYDSFHSREFDKKWTLLFCSVKLKCEALNLISCLWGHDSQLRWHFKTFFFINLAFRLHSFMILLHVSERTSTPTCHLLLSFHTPDLNNQLMTTRHCRISAYQKGPVVQPNGHSAAKCKF